MIFIVGLQKSGTSLLRRLLTTLPGVQHPFRGEGSDFWGNEPPFSPTAHPAGTIYQATHGNMGHAAGPDEATSDIASVLRERLQGLAMDDGPVVNKNPFNSVRIGWLRHLFPNARIVAIYRNPLPNIYSLSKKFIEHDSRGRGPEAGWWGVKPPGWRMMVNTDTLAQLAAQWNAINQAILANTTNVNQLIRYDDFCRAPRANVGSILDGAGFDAEGQIGLIPEHLHCLDEEYLSGSRLLSRNRDYVKSGNFRISQKDNLEHPPMAAADIDRLSAMTDHTLHLLDLARHHER